MCTAHLSTTGVQGGLIVSATVLCRKGLWTGFILSGPALVVDAGFFTVSYTCQGVIQSQKGGHWDLPPRNHVQFVIIP